MVCAELYKATASPGLGTLVIGSLLLWERNVVRRPVIKIMISGVAYHVAR